MNFHWDVRPEISRTTLAGTPATTTFEGTSSRTREPAATILPIPIVTPPSNVAEAPIHTPSSKRIVSEYPAPAALPLFKSNLCDPVTKLTLGPMSQFLPIYTSAVPPIIRKSCPTHEPSPIDNFPAVKKRALEAILTFFPMSTPHHLNNRFLNSKSLVGGISLTINHAI